METIRYEHRHTDVACELTATGAAARGEEWRRLRESAGLGSESIDNGARIWLRPEAARATEDLAQREADCCGFLDLELEILDDRLRLDITSPVPAAVGVIASLAGLDQS
jgi:hypothetical protein